MEYKIHVFEERDQKLVELLKLTGHLQFKEIKHKVWKVLDTVKKVVEWL